MSKNKTQSAAKSAKKGEFYMQNRAGGSMTMRKGGNMALHNNSTLRRSICSVVQYSTLIGAQVLIAAIMTVIANKFNIRYLSDVTILLWIVLAILFCLMPPRVIAVKLLLSVLSFFVSTGLYSALLFIYKAGR